MPVEHPIKGEPPVTLFIDPDRADDRPNARVDYVSARYFETMGMQILRGRGFRDTDREGMPRVAVINQTLARVRFGAR